MTAIMLGQREPGALPCGALVEGLIDTLTLTLVAYKRSPCQRIIPIVCWCPIPIRSTTLFPPNLQPRNGRIAALVLEQIRAEFHRHGQHDPRYAGIDQDVPGWLCFPRGYPTRGDWAVSPERVSAATSQISSVHYK